MAVAEARQYPSQMQDYVMTLEVEGAVDARVAVMVMEILYGNGTFRPLTEAERVTANLLMFSDVLPDDADGSMESMILDLN